MCTHICILIFKCKLWKTPILIYNSHLTHNMFYSSVLCFCLVCQLSLGLYIYRSLFINFSKMSVLTDSYSHSALTNPQSYTTMSLLSLPTDCLNTNSSFTYSNFITVFIHYLFCKSRYRFRMIQQHWSNRRENEIEARQKDLNCRPVSATTHKF